MNNEALNYAYDLFLNDGYNGTIEDFSNLLSTNDDAVNYIYSLFKNDGYENTIDDFKNLLIDSSLKQPKDSKDVVKNLINIDNNTTYEKDTDLKQSILEKYFEAPSVDLSKIEGAKTIDSPMGQGIDFGTIKFEDAATASEDQLKERFGEEKYNLYKKYQETKDLNKEDIPDSILPAFEEIQNEETKKRSRFLKEEQVRKNKGLIDGSFLEAIKLDEDVKGLYSTDFVEDYAEIEKEAEQYKSKASGELVEGVDEFGVPTMRVKKIGEAKKVKTKKELVGKAVKLQNKYLQNVSDVLNNDLTAYDKELQGLGIKTGDDLEAYLGNQEIDIETRRNVLNKNNELNKRIKEFQTQSIKFGDKMGALEALDKSYSWGYRAALNMEKAILGDIGQLVLGVGAMTADIISPESKAAKYLRNNYVAHIDYAESIQQKQEANLPATIKLADVGLENAGTFIGQQLGNNIFSIGTALTYAGVVKNVTSKPVKKYAKRALQSTFFGVEGGSKLSDMEIAQKNAAKNLSYINDRLENEELTPDKRLQLEEEKEKSLKALNYTQGQRAFTALTYGGIATVAETLGTMRWIDDISAMRKLTGDLSMKSILRGTGNFIIKSPGTELVEETATQIGHNLMDNLILKDNKSLVEGVDPDFFASTFITALAIGGPAIAPGVRNAFRNSVQTKEETEKFRDLATEFIENQYILKEGTNLSKGGINKKQADFIKARQLEILNEAGRLDIEGFNKISDLDANQITKLFDISRKQGALYNKSFELGTTGLDDATIKRDRDRLNKEYNDLQSEKEAILNEPAKKRNQKLKETAKEEGLEESAAMKESLNYGRAAYYDNLVKGLGKKVIKFDGENALADLEKYLDDNNVDANTKTQIIKGFNEGGNGTFNGNDILTFERNRRMTILFGTDIQKADAIQVAVHELQHQYDIEKGLVKDGKIVASHRPLVTALQDHIKELYNRGDISKDIYNQFKRRADQYREKVNKNKVIDQTELLTLLGTMKRAGMLKDEKTSLLYEIKSLINGVRAKFLKENATLLDMNTTSDVLRYIDTFNKKVDQGKAIVQLPPEEEVVVKQSKEASDNVQRIYKEQGVAGAMDIIEQFKPITSKIAERRRAAPNFDKELLMSEIEIGERGIFDLIREYKPESGVPLAAYINKFLPARAIEASRRVLGEEFTEDVTEKVDIAAEEVTTEIKTKPKKKKIVLADRLGVTDKVVKAINKIAPKLDVDKLTFKTLKNKIPKITGELFGIAPKKIESLANLTKKELQSAQMFINKNADLLITMLPEGATASGTATGIPNTLLKAFYTKSDRAKMVKTGSKAGLAVQQKNKINKKDFLETFGIIDGKPVRTDRNTSARVLALANLTGKMMTNQALRQKLGQDDAKAKEVVSRIKDGKSPVMFSKGLENPLDNFQLTYEHQLGVLSESLFGKNVRIPNHKSGLLKGTRNLEAIFDKETGETYRDAAIRVINTFLESHPQYRGLIRSTMTGGKKAGLFKFVNSSDKNFIKHKKRTGDDINFDDNIVDYPDVEQVGKKQSYNKNEKYSSNFHEKINTNEFKKENAKKLQELLEFFKGVQAHLQNFPNDVWLFEEMLLDTSKHMNTLTRILAPISFYPVDPKTKEPIFNKKAVEEHTDPQNLIGKALLAGAFFGKLDDVWKVVGKSYMQGSILKVDDPSGDLKANMPQSYYDGVVPRLLSGDLKLPNGYSSIIRLAEAGVDPNAYMLINENKTIAEFFGVDGILNPETKSFDVKRQNEIIIKQLTGEVAPRYGENIAKVKFSKNVDGHNKLNEAIVQGRKINKQSKGITVLDFDDTLATTKSLVKFTTPEGKTGTLNAEEFANTYEDLQDQGYTFDFSDFNKVVKGKLAPLFKKALKLQGKFGPENMFVLTARPPQAAKAIFDFLKANGLNIPIKNITGLGNSTAEAKALWIADKVGEGYNDFYFADDALQNVQAVKNMLDQFDVKSKVQQAKVNFSKGLDPEFNKILQEVTGIDAVKRFSDTKARKRGESKGKFRFFIPPSHEDFVGLLYNFMGKGRKGDGHRNFFEQALIRPLNRAYREIDTAKQAIANDYKSLNKQFPDVKKKLVKNTPNGDFTFQDAIRVYLWNKHGYTIPGLTKTDQQNLVDIVMKDSELQAYAETLNTISKQETYVDPGPNWETGNIRIDLVDATGRVGRASYFTEFNENADIIFSPENLNKIEAAYGKDFREALEDMLHRIKTGVNRPKGASAKPNIFMNWLNASVSGVMFFNTRSSLLQQMSNVNFLNFADNNIYAAGKAFANQPQYWKDFAMIFNSDMLKQRRGGLQTDINGAEMAEAIKKARPGNMFDQVSIIVGKALRLGFLPTQIGDNIAIATGGAAFYRNRVNKYIKDGLSKKEAESKAFIDLQDITNSTQQSARPDMTSAQQASWVGKLILNFLNTPSQYNRIIKKAGSDIKNRRITPPNTSQMQSDMSNMSRILYYGAAQNLIFYGLQTALFAVMFGLEDDDEEKRAEQFLKKKERVINGSIDTILRGSGIYGVAVSTLKNMIIKFAEQREKGYNKDESAVLMEALNFSPVVGIRARSIVNAEKTVNYNEKVIKEMETFDIDNPMWSAVTNYVQVTGLPANRVYQKTINLRNASDNQYTAFQRALFFSGYTTWSLNLGDTQKMKDIKEKVKSKKKKSKVLKKSKFFDLQ